MRRVADRFVARASAVSPWAARFVGGELLRQRRFADAEALLTAAVAAFPRHAGVRARHARVAEIDGRFAEAATRWREVCALAPESAAPWRGLASALRLHGDLSGASEAVARAEALRPNDWSTRVETARIQDRLGQHTEAAAIWADVVRRRPADPFARQGYANCLMRLDRLDEAARQIADGFEHHPGHQGLVAAQGLLAMRRQDWDDAFAIWSSYTATYPDDVVGQDFLLRVKGMQSLANEAQGQPSRLLVPVAVERVEDEDVRALMLRFESIGNDCEFGLVQRRYGAEPLGLLRWNVVTFPTLIAALEARFVDMGEPETTELTIGSEGEIYLRDLRWDLSMNLFLFTHEVSPDVLLAKMCRRVVYLRDKFVADLAAAEKVLVFKSNVIDLDGLQALHRALRVFGPVRLVNVRRADIPMADRPLDLAPGEVVCVAPDLYVGVVTHMGNEGSVWDIAHDQWVSICRGVEAAAPTAVAVTAAHPVTA